MIGTGESGLPFYNPFRMLKLSAHAWEDAVTGNLNLTTLVSVPFYFAISVLYMVGFPVVASQMATFWLVLVVGSLSVYYLTLLTIPGRNSFAMFAGLFYMLNPFSMVNIWNRLQYSYMFFYALMPLALLFYIKGLNTHKTTYVLYINLASFAFLSAFAVVPFIGTFWLVLSSCFIFYILTNLHNRSEIVYSVKFSLLAICLWLLLNFWWITQFLIGSGYVFTAYMSPTSNLAILSGISQSLGSLSFVIRLIHREFFINMRPVWGNIYFSDVFITISFLIPLLVFSSMLLKPRNKLVSYFTFLSILGLFLAKGAAPPFGELFQWIFVNIPAFQVFRNPFEKFGIILPLGYAPLFGVGLSLLHRWMKGHANISIAFSRRIRTNFRNMVADITIISICFLILGAYVWPMWNGWVFTSSIKPANNVEIGDYVSIPPYYKEANSWLTNQRGIFRLVVLPIDGIGITHNWTYGYAGVELSNQLLDVSSISASYGVLYIDDIVSKLEQTLLDNPASFWKVMALLNAKYVMVRSDIDHAERNMRAPQEIKQALLKTKYINYVRSFGKLDFYKLNDDCFLDRIYVTNQFAFSKDVSTMLSTDIQNESFMPGDCILFLRSQSNMNNMRLLDNLKTEGLHKPNISFEKVDPTRYVVHVRDAKYPYFIVFSETYHPQWKAYVNDEQVPDEYHFIANGYANSWYISKTGSYDIILEFWPQRLLYMGSAISMVTLAFCVIYISKKQVIRLYPRLLRKKPSHEA
jgi:hypothetical protein